MSKTKNTPQTTKLPTVFIAILLFILTIVATAYVTYTFIREQSKDANLDVASLSALITTADGVRPSTYPELQRELPDFIAALTDYSGDTPCRDLMGRYKLTVLRLSDDKTQALIGSGCGGFGDVRWIMKKDGDTWMKIGAPVAVQLHNQDNEAQFDTQLDVPSCETTKKHAIDLAIAPVCYTGDPAHPSSYTVRQ